MWQRAAIAAVAVAAAVALSIPVIRHSQRRTSAATGRRSPVACAPGWHRAGRRRRRPGRGHLSQSAGGGVRRQEAWTQRRGRSSRFHAAVAPAVRRTGCRTVGRNRGRESPCLEAHRKRRLIFAATRLKLLNLRTGAVSDAAEAPAPAGATWLRDGSLLFVPATGPVRRLLAGKVSDATRLASGDVAHAFPVGPPNGRDFTYIAVRGDGRRVVRLRAGGTDTDLGATGTHAELLDRWLLLVRDATLL